MQEPFAGVSINPDQRIIRQSRNEVVTARFVAIPPPRFDALRSGEQGKLALLQSLGLHQPHGPRTGLAELARIPLPRLDAPPGVLGTMIGMRRKAVDRVVPQ